MNITKKKTFLIVPLHEASSDVSVSFLESTFNFFVELEKSAFKSIVYSHGNGLELKHPAGSMYFSVPNIQVVETAARRTRISESDNNNIAVIDYLLHLQQIN